jgi:ring-1,2-phenylacetyl-CoA epoxidase subunit PaaD
MTTEFLIEALRDVKDPEIPAISVVDLGIITGVEFKDEDEVVVAMTPTFVGCPAIHLMQQQIKERIQQLGFAKVDVVIDRSVAWTSDRITEKGREALRSFKLVPPPVNAGNLSVETLSETKCPHCGSANTSLQNLFGPTLCRAIHYCYDCRQGFEQMKPV